MFFPLESKKFIGLNPDLLKTKHEQFKPKYQIHSFFTLLIFRKNNKTITRHFFSIFRIFIVTNKFDFYLEILSKGKKGLQNELTLFLYFRQNVKVTKV